MIDHTIRLATDSDMKAMLSIYDYYVQHTSITFDHETPSIVDFTRKIHGLQKLFPVLVYEVNNEVVGYAYASFFREKKAYQWTVETTIYLSHLHISKGIGSRLYEKLFELLQQQNFRFAIAVITIPNDESIQFHKKFGFYECGKMKNIGFKMDRWWSILYMMKSIQNIEDSTVKDPIKISDLNLK